jgi:DNA-directed RNA polymerase II subunit RPB2
MALASVGSDANEIIEKLQDMGVKEFEQMTTADLLSTKVFVNGNWIGFTSDANQLYNDFITLRRENGIKAEISILRDFGRREIRLCTDPGRVQRPLYVVENN